MAELSNIGKIEKIAIIGTGLIGASFAAALKSKGFTGHIAGCATTDATITRALELGLIDSGSTSASVVADNADLVMLAVPMMGFRQVLENIAPVLKDSCIVTDGGSVKGSMIEDARQVLGELSRVVPGHPIAGKEFSGVDAADSVLYAGQLVILTPDATTDPVATRAVQQLWELCGARVEVLRADDHDRVLAATSHLPHVIAFGIVDMLAKHQSRDEVFRYSAGGFRDFTRIASGDPVMWRDICLSNGGAISEILGELMQQLAVLKDQIEASDGAALEQVFTNAKTTRDALIVKYDSDLLAQQSARNAANKS